MRYFVCAQLTHCMMGMMNTNIEAGDAAFTGDTPMGEASELLLLILVGGHTRSHQNSCNRRHSK